MAKTKQTEANKKIILEAAALGMTDKDCYTLACMSHECFYKWLRDDPEFSDSIARERIKGKRLHIENIHKAASRDARHSEWFLSHRFAEDFSEKRVMEVRGEDKSPHELILEALESAEMEESSEDT